MHDHLITTDSQASEGSHPLYLIESKVAQCFLNDGSQLVANLHYDEVLGSNFVVRFYETHGLSETELD